MADRVGYVLKKFPRLAETFILSELLGLEEAGRELTIFSLRPPDAEPTQPELGALRANVQYLTWPARCSTLESLRLLAELDPGRTAPALPTICSFLDRIPSRRRAATLIQALELARCVERQRISHLHAHFMTVAAHTAYLVHLLIGVPFSVTAHAKDIYRSTVDRDVFREIATAASTVVTVCDANRRFIKDRLLADGPGTVVRIYNGVRASTDRAQQTAREPNLLLAVGRLVEKKGFDVLIAACELLREQGADFRCVVLGDGDQREQLVRSAEALNLEDRVEFPGMVSSDAIRDWMARARVLAAPCVVGADGNQDALPTVLVEALNAGPSSSHHFRRRHT